MKKVIIGKIGGEDWVGTNEGGIGRLLFKLQESEEIYDKNESMAEEVERLRSERDELLEVLCGIQNACIGQIAMGHALEPEIIGLDITEATKMTNPELNAYISKIKGNDNA